MPNRPKSVNAVLHLEKSCLILVQDKSFKYFHAIKFIYEQLQLIKQNKLDSAEIFPSWMYNYSPRRYRL